MVTDRGACRVRYDQRAGTFISHKEGAPSIDFTAEARRLIARGTCIVVKHGDAQPELVVAALHVPSQWVEVVEVTPC